MKPIKRLIVNIALPSVLFIFLSQTSFSQPEPVTIRTTDKVDLFVKQSGTGKPILFIHGGPGSSCVYFEKGGGTIFESAATMIYLDQRGCGRSGSSKSKDYSLERVVEDFEEVRMALGYRQWTVMAHSFGGILATEYAARYPDSIESLIMLNATISIPDSARSLISQTIEIIPELTEGEVAYLNNEDEALTNRFNNAFWHLSQYDRKYRLQFEHKQNHDLDVQWISDPDLNWDMAQNVFNYSEYLISHAEKTASIVHPVLIISGTKDYAIGIDHPEIMQFPNKTITYLEGSHALYMERQEALFAAVTPFIKSPYPGQAQSQR